MKSKILNRHKIRMLREACKNNTAVMVSEIEKRLKLDVDDPKHLTPRNFNFGEIAVGLGGDIAHYSDTPIFSEAVTASQFSTIVATLLSKIVMDAYTEDSKIGDLLVTKFTSTQETDKVPGGYLEGGLADVNEHGEYPHIGDVQEKYVEIGHQKRGMIIDVTDEAVRFDRTGIVMDRAAQLGRRMARDRELRILNTVQDITSYKAWYPSGSNEDLYADALGSATHTYDNLVTDVLADYTDVSALYNLLRLMKDENADPIRIDPKILLVPVALEITANRIIVNDVLPGGTNNERNPFANRFKVLASQDLDAQSSTAWYLGDFKKQFKEKVVIPPQVARRRYGDNNEDAWRRDIVASYKVRYDCSYGAVDYCYVGKSTGAG